MKKMLEYAEAGVNRALLYKKHCFVVAGERCCSPVSSHRNSFTEHTLSRFLPGIPYFSLVSTPPPPPLNYGK
jgi:hypothetical protein